MDCTYFAKPMDGRERMLHAVNEHFEFIINAVSPSTTILRWVLQKRGVGKGAY